MRKFLVFLLLLGAALFVTNPDRDVYYEKVLEDQGLGTETFTTLKYTAVELAYTYENYHIGGVLRNKLDENIAYVGFFTFVIKLPQ